MYYYSQLQYLSRICFNKTQEYISFLSLVGSLFKIATHAKKACFGIRLCDTSDESRDHIFVGCSYSQEVWNSFFHHPNFILPHDFQGIIHWLSSASSNIRIRNICNLLVQAIVYVLWRERNTRLHTATRKPSLLLVKEVTRLIKAKLIGLDSLISPLQRSLQRSPTSESYLHIWFRYFDV